MANAENNARRIIPDSQKKLAVEVRVKQPFPVPERIKADCLDAIGNALTKDLVTMSHDVRCGCPACIAHANQIKDYWELPALISEKDAKNFITVYEKRSTKRA